MSAAESENSGRTEAILSGWTITAAATSFLTSSMKVRPTAAGTTGGECRTSSREPSSPGAAARDVRAISEYGALTSALNWYRAIPLMDMRRQFHKITIPTM